MVVTLLKWQGNGGSGGFSHHDKPSDPAAMMIDGPPRDGYFASTHHGACHLHAIMSCTQRESLNPLQPPILSLLTSTNALTGFVNAQL
jgi:hypothetical protein